MTPNQERVMQCFSHESFEWTATQVMEMTSLGPAATYAALYALEHHGVLKARRKEGPYPQQYLYSLVNPPAPEPADVVRYCAHGQSTAMNPCQQCNPLMRR